MSQQEKYLENSDRRGSDVSPEEIYAEFETQAQTPTEREVLDWAKGPTLEMAESEDAVDERIADGTSLRESMLTDLKYRLGEQLPDMAEDTIGAPEEHQAKAQARVAIKLADRLK